MKTTSGFNLVHATFAEPPRHIPNGKGDPFKTELVIERSLEGVTKINWWHGPDDDRAPHNHPWKDEDGVSFVSEILHGSLTHVVYWVGYEAGGIRPVVKTRTETFSKGDKYDIDYAEYHVVTAVAPGTVTRMTCSKVVDGNEWGYLDPVSGVYTKAEKDPTFMDKLRANNRFIK